MSENSSIRVVFLWSNVSGYMASCWKKMHQSSAIDLRVVAYGDSTATAFADEIMGDVDWIPLAANERQNSSKIERVTQDFNPDIIVVSGWLNSAYMKITKSTKFANAKFIMAMDTPWQGTARQHLASIALKPYLSRFDAVFVTGERAWIYGRKLGVSETKLHKGLYGVDYETLSQLFLERRSTAWPKQFVFVGRYSEQKGIADLIDAYRNYRKQVPDPWPLVCCGKGKLETLLKDEPGVQDKGFLQPVEMQQVLLKSGVLILPSHFDPWPLALVEACASGLPVIATRACGSAVECVRDYFNGFMCATNEPESLASAMIKSHRSYTELPEFGERSALFASAYSNAQWLKRWHEVFSSVASRSNHSEPAGAL